MTTYKTKPIGEIFEYCGIKLQVVGNIFCGGCYFSDNCACMNNRSDTGYCSMYNRKDQKSVIFKRINNE